jgi:hypothetical protein
MIRVAFLINFNHIKWIGGLNIIVNLLNSIALQETQFKKIKLLVVTKNKNDLIKLNLNKKIEIIEDDKIFNLSIFKRIIDKLLVIFLGKTFFFEKFLIKHKIDIITHSNIATGKNSSVKSIVWIPDFQYLHFPKYFSFKYRLFRYFNLILYKKHSTIILLSSKDAYKDLKKIIKINSNKIKIHNFSFFVPPKEKLLKINLLKKKYNIPKQYFFLPNQYWVHKNHEVVIKALSILIKKKKNLNIISTGNNFDYRNPNHFNNILNLIKKYKLKKYYYYLGIVSYIDVMALMKNSIAVINPSLFEGWSSTIEQAKSYGKKIVLSNINVHLEQNPSDAEYFDPTNANQLSKILLNIYKKKDFRKDEKNYMFARNEMIKNLKRYALFFLDIIQDIKIKKI